MRMNLKDEKKSEKEEKEVGHEEPIKESDQVVVKGEEEKTEPEKEAVEVVGDSAPAASQEIRAEKEDEE